MSRISSACCLQNRPLWAASVLGLLHPIAKQTFEAGSIVPICAKVDRGTATRGDMGQRSDCGSEDAQHH